MSTDGLNAGQKQALEEVDHSLDKDGPPSGVVERAKSVFKEGADALEKQGKFPPDQNATQ